MQALAQANAVNTQIVTRSQSLAAVQTLLRAGLSCITFLRNLLPEDNFSEGSLTTADESFPPSASETDGTPQGSNKRSRTNGLRIMTLTRGYTDEADRLLNYMENGIFHALEKQYLRSFIFAIYLDNKDPTNIVEAYTFNFKYHTIPGTSTVVPVMSLGDDLQKMSLDGRGKKPVDPVSEAIQMGRAPTIRDVRKSVKTMIKTLIQAITHMEDLPRRRFATFKLFYTDTTPVDYEPPNFQTGDEHKDRWYFMTHNLEEVPDRFSVGQVNCGYHSVNLKVTSIATYLPAPSKDENTPFVGTLVAARGTNRPRATPNEDALTCARQAEEQREDAIMRNLVWSTEEDAELSDPDADGECEDDPDYVKMPDGTYERIMTFDKLNMPYVPKGIRNDNGRIEPINVSTMTAETQTEAHFAGISERVPTRLNELNAKESSDAAMLEETQALLETQPLSVEPQSHGSFTFNLQPPQRDASASLPPSNLAMDLESPASSAPATPIARRRSRASIRASTQVPQDTEMLDLETQPVDMDSQMRDSITSFSLNAPAPAEAIDKAPSPPAKADPSASTKDVGLECDCSITVEDEVCFCEGGCGRWYHVWCMGFHSVDDSRLPAKFICFDCRLRADVVSWTMIKDSVYPQIMTKYRDFVTFRRAIKVAETTKIITPTEFAKSFDGDSSLARQLLKQLEEEDFIKVVTTTIDEFGLAIESRAKSVKGKDRKHRSRKNVQKTRYAFNKQIKSQKKYKDYFTPEQEIESRMLGLDDYRKFRNENDPGIAPRRVTSAAPKVIKLANAVAETQTQDETQALQFDDDLVSRRGVDAVEGERPKKKMKISVAAGIDLAE